MWVVQEVLSELEPGRRMEVVLAPSPTGTVGPTLCETQWIVMGSPISSKSGCAGRDT